MTDLERKQLIYAFVEESAADGEIRDESFNRIMGQISFAYHCEIITKRETEELMDKVCAVKKSCQRSTVYE